MNIKKIYFLLTAIFFILAFLLFLDFASCLNGSNCTFHGMEVAGFIFYPVAIFVLGSAGIIFVTLALVHKSKLNNSNVTPQNIIHKSINPVVLLGIGTVMFLVPYFDKSIGLDLFGVKTLLYFGAILFLCAGFIKLFKSLHG